MCLKRAEQFGWKITFYLPMLLLEILPLKIKPIREKLQPLLPKAVFLPLILLPRWTFRVAVTFQHPTVIWVQDPEDALQPGHLHSLGEQKSLQNFTDQLSCTVLPPGLLSIKIIFHSITCSSVSYNKTELLFLQHPGSQPRRSPSPKLPPGRIVYAVNSSKLKL